MYIDSVSEQLIRTRIPKIFDQRSQQNFTDGCVMRQVNFDKGIKKIMIHQHQSNGQTFNYLILGTFRNIKQEAKPDIESSKLQYEIEIYDLPTEKDWRSYNIN